MNGKIKIAMVLGTLLVLIIGVSCITGETFTHNDAQHYKHHSATVEKINNSSFEKVSVTKETPADSHTVKKTVAKKNTKTVTKSNSVATKKSVKKVKTQDKTEKKVAEKKVNVSDAKKDSVRAEDKTVNGWNPKDHEVSREDLGDGMQRVTYDDGYHRVVDEDGNVLSYGY